MPTILPLAPAGAKVRYPTNPATRERAAAAPWRRARKQGDDPAKLAEALLTTPASSSRRRASSPEPTVAQAEEKLAERRQEADALRGLSTSLALDEVPA